MRKVLIANRGEIACRIIRSCRTLGIETVAVHSEADTKSKHVLEADEAYPIGPSAAKESYLVIDKILAIAKATSSDAIHPGYGFLAENQTFAQRIIESGLEWIGPSPQTIADMGDKERARNLAQKAGVKTVPGSRRFSPNDLNGLNMAGDNIGYPLLIKATAGGGGIGMKRVDEPDKLKDSVETTQAMAEKAFGNGTIYLEKLIPTPRHIEIQVFGFGDGRAVHFFERECSIQRRYQKIIEEAPAATLPPTIKSEMAKSAIALTEQENYSGAGTIEFILAPNLDFYFLEMNTRIQVEHPVSEMITGYDLVGLQLKLSRGDLNYFSQNSITENGHAIECRVYAENPDKNFLPSPGLLEEFTPPAEGDGIRIDTGVQKGDNITYFYDPMIAKLIAFSDNRANAIDKLLIALGEFRIEGIVTNIDFLKRVISHQDFLNGNTHTGFIEQHKTALFLE